MFCCLVMPAWLVFALWCLIHFGLGVLCNFRPGCLAGSDTRRGIFNWNRGLEKV